MYNNFFHLTSDPFGINPNPKFLYMMPHTREALAGLVYGISSRKGFIVLTGEVGTGKTTLLNRALLEFDQRRLFTSFVFNPRLDITDFLEFVLIDFGITPVSRSKSSMLIQLNRWLVERYARKEVCVVIVDEAQNLSLDLLEEIRLLTNLETSTEKLLQIVLSGQPEFEEKLRDPSVRQLRQRISIWCRTHVLSAEETAAYIAQRLRIAGASERIFSDEAAAAVYNLSRGIPRTINLICEHALIHCYAEQLRIVPAEVVFAAAQDLGLQVREFRSQSGGGYPIAADDRNGSRNPSSRIPG